MFNKGHIVFHYGDNIHENFYVILKGNVDVFVPKTETEIQMDFKRIIIEIKKASIDGNGMPDIIQMLNLMKKEILSSDNNNNYKNSSHDNSPIVDIKESKDDHHHVDFTNCSHFGEDFILKVKKIFMNKKYNKVIAQSWIDALSIIPYYVQQKSLIEIFSKNEQYSSTYIQYGYFKYKKIRSYGMMECFGELAVLPANCKLGETIVISSNEAQLGSITKVKYKNIFEANIENSITKLNFFRQYFGTSMIDLLSKFVHYFHEKKYSYGQKLFIQGEKSKEIFIIQEGEVQVNFFLYILYE